MAVAEAKRGAGDLLYGYYTRAKLMILKLRDDYEVKQGASYALPGATDCQGGVPPFPRNSTSGSPACNSVAARGHSTRKISRSRAFETFPHVTHNN